MMRKTILTIVMLTLTCGAMAQQHNNKNFAKRLFEARLAEVCLRLELTDEVKEKFAPLYEQYCQQLQSLRPMQPGAATQKRPKAAARQFPPNAPKMGVGKNAAPHAKPVPSDADKVKDIKQKLEAQRRAQELRLAYMEKFDALLTDKQLVKFYEVEDDIQRRLHDRSRQGLKSKK